LIAQTLTLHAANVASRRNDINIPLATLLSGATKKFPRAASTRQISSRSIVDFSSNPRRILVEFSARRRATRVCRHHRPRLSFISVGTGVIAAVARNDGRKKENSPSATGRDGPIKRASMRDTFRRGDCNVNAETRGSNGASTGAVAHSL